MTCNISTRASKVYCTKQLYSDNGPEYVGLRHYLRGHGIEWEESAPYTPQQNGNAERLNRTLLNMFRSMLRHASLSQRVWREALCTTLYLKNIIRTNSNVGRTPMEMLAHKKPFLGNLRTFGCKLWVHAPKWKKLYLKSKKCILLCYILHFNNRVYDIAAKQVITSRHVKFEENLFPGRRLFPGEGTVIHENDKMELNDDSREPDVRNNEAQNEGTGTTVRLSTFSAGGNSAEVHGEDVQWDHSATDGVKMEGEGENVESEQGCSQLTVSALQQFVTHYPARRYPDRERNAPDRYGSTHVTMDVARSFPQSIEEALDFVEAQNWRRAIQGEVQGLKDMHTWEVMKPSTGARVIHSRYVFTRKQNPNGSLERYKARLVA
eukprot:gb/GEZJ01003340.1/.p1 GENE.gb/GEZJ01003340.1/~~gb/GEZJ01003340.1/.p1  ORF type:complete len:378 (-),score=44.30 gb/GEZJ01003340.1/:720-1853(-)